MWKLAALAATVLTTAALLTTAPKGTAIGETAPAGAAAGPIKVCLISGSKEYKSEESLTELKKHLEAGYNVECFPCLGQDGGSDLPGLEALDGCDVMVVFCRRMKLPQDQLDRVRKHCQAGKAVIGIRTASHAFQGWLEFDKEVLGGDYKGHGAAEKDIQVRCASDAAREHPILAGVKEWVRDGKLYRNPSPAADITVLLTGAAASGTQPLAWARTYDKDKDARAFYTSMGFPHDFQDDNFRRMLVNAIAWTAGRAVERR